MQRPQRPRSTINDKLAWDGSPATFDTYKGNLIGHLLQVGGGYLTRADFHKEYLDSMNTYGVTDAYICGTEFCAKYQISIAQGLYDRQYLYGVLQSSLKTRTKDNVHLQQHETTQDGILVLIAWLAQYSNKGSTKIRIDELERELNSPCPSNSPGDVPAFIDSFLSKCSQLDGLYKKAESEGGEVSNMSTWQK